KRRSSRGWSSTARGWDSRRRLPRRLRALPASVSVRTCRASGTNVPSLPQIIAFGALMRRDAASARMRCPACRARQRAASGPVASRSGACAGRVLRFRADGRLVKNPLRRLRIGTRLFLIVLVMMVLTLAVSSFIYSYFESTLIGEIQDQSESLSKALQISVQEMTSEELTDDSLLKDYVERLSSRGVKEISILSNEKEVVASSNPARVRKKGGLRGAAGGSSTSPAPKMGGTPEGLVLTGTLSEQEIGDTLGKTSRELDIPIIVNNEKRGYIRLHLLFDDFSELIRTAHRRRLIALIAVFAAGTAGIAGLSLGLTRSLRELSRAAAQVAEGDLSVRLAPTHEDEAGKVMETFNQMVVRLRDQRALEERLRRAEHLSAIGNLASAGAHEIRKPLDPISLRAGHLGPCVRPPRPGQAKREAR